jgi:hypothetical protein
MVRGSRPKQTPIKLSKEEKELKKQQIENDRAWKLRKKRENEEQKLQKKELKNNINILKYMKKNDVIYYHHSEEESMIKKIKEYLEYIKKTNRFTEYINSRYTPLCLLGCKWSGDCDFDSIYDVPLNGEYEFYITDSGMRGLGSYDYLHLKKVESKVHIPFVNPGGLIPITAM